MNGFIVRKVIGETVTKRFVYNNDLQLGRLKDSNAAEHSVDSNTHCTLRKIAAQPVKRHNQLIHAKKDGAGWAGWAGWMGWMGMDARRWGILMVFVAQCTLVKCNVLW